MKLRYSSDEEDNANGEKRVSIQYGIEDIINTNTNQEQEKVLQLLDNSI